MEGYRSLVWMGCLSSMDAERTFASPPPPPQEEGAPPSGGGAAAGGGIVSSSQAAIKVGLTCI